MCPVTLHAPTPGLRRAPNQDVERGGARCEGVRGVAAERLDTEAVQIGAPDRGRAIIGLQRLPPVVILEHEQAGVGGVLARAPAPGVGGIAKRGMRGNRSDRGEVAALVVVSVLSAVKAAPVTS